MTDTINRGTTLIEEGALMSESLRYESEPWTCFYRAGEIIQELRKLSGKRSKCGSEGNMAQSDEIIDHSNHPGNLGSLPKDNPNAYTGLVGASECGDVMKLQMKVNTETQVVEEPEFKTFDCGSAMSGSSLASERVQGKTSRKRWPSRTRISSGSSAFPRAALPDATGYSRIGRRLLLVGSPIF